MKNLETAIRNIKETYPSINIILCKVKMVDDFEFHAHVVNANIEDIKNIEYDLSLINLVCFDFRKWTVSPTSIVMHPEDLIGKTILSL